jgi:DNA polymerase-3 subunit delta'
VEAGVHAEVHPLMPLSPGERKEGEEALEGMRAMAAQYLRQSHEPAPSANIPVESIRLLQKKMAYAPTQAERKIGLIFAAERMHPAGANSLLKMLEDPPARAVFILVSSTPERLLPTVLSRCQKVRLRRLGREHLRRQLQARGVEGERLELAVRWGEGSLQRATRVADGEVEALREQVQAFLEGGAQQDAEVYWRLLEELGAERGQVEHFLEVCGLYLRDLYLMAYGRGGEATLVDRRPFLERLSLRLPLGQIEAAALEVDRAFDYLRRNANLQLVLVDLWRCLQDRAARRSTA